MRNALLKIPRKHRVWLLLLCGTALYFFANIQRVAIPGSIFNILQQEFEVSAPYITGLGSSFMYVYALAQLIIGLLVDRYGGGRVISCGALLFCTGSLMFPLSHTMFMLYLSRILTGLGASCLYLSLVREIMRAFNKNFTIMLAVMILIGYAGGIVANAPLVMYINITGWRHAILMTGFVSIAFYLLFMMTKTTLKMPPLHTERFSFLPFAKILKKRHNRNLFLFVGINFGLYYVLQTVIGKKFLEDFCLINSDNSAMILSVMSVISALSGLSFALISRMIGNRRQIFVRIVGISCITIFTVITLLLALEIRSVWIAVLMCLLASTASTSSIAVPLLRETNDAEFTGAAVSILNFGCYITVALFGNAVGLLMNLFPPEHRDGIMVYGANSYLAVFGTMLGFSIIVLRSSFRLRETRGENLSASTF
jgi:MFS family permease